MTKRTPETRWRIPWRRLAIAVSPIAVLLVILYVIGSRREDALRSPESALPPGASQIEILPDGVPLAAGTGTIGHELVDWLNAPGEGERYFEVGGLQYRGRSADLLPKAQRRLGSLVDLLGAYPRVSVTIVGYTNRSDDPAADLALSKTRAEKVLVQLVQGGVDPARLSAAGRGAANTLKGRPAQESERIAIAFNKSRHHRFP